MSWIKSSIKLRPTNSENRENDGFCKGRRNFGIFVTTSAQNRSSNPLVHF